MRVNSMDKINEVKSNNLIYIMIAVVCGIIAGFFLTFIFEALIIFGKFLIKYWWGALIGIAIIFLLRFRKRKKGK